MLTDHIPDILTLAEAARALRCSKTHICKAVRGEIAGVEAIPAIPFGRRKLIRKEALITWIERNERGVQDDTIRPSERGARRRA
jgi:excisionase family DNA binding protein